MSSSAMLRAIRGALFLALVWAAGDAAFGQKNSPPAVKPTPEPTPIPLASVPAEIQSAMTILQETAASVTRVRASMDAVADRLGKLTGEIEPRMAEDSVLLQGNPSLDMLYRTKLSWQDFQENLALLSRELTQHTVSLDEELARLKELSKSWQTALQTARQENVPSEALQNLQDFVNSVEQARQSVETERGRALTELSRVSDEETRVRKILSLVDQTQVQALKDLLVRDSPFIWSPKRGLGTEWEVRSGVSFASQFRAATAFGKRLPLAFFLHAVLIVLLAIGLRWMRRAVLSRAKAKPQLARALPILDLPLATAFVLTVLVSPWIYPEAPRLIQVLLGTLALIPAVLILRRLLDRKFAPILYFLVAMYFIDQLRVLAASLPELVRFLFLAEMLGASLFLLWLLRSRQLAATAEKTSARFTNAVRAICVIGLILLPAAIVANTFGYLNLAYLLGMIFLRSVYMAALLYTAIRILEGLIIIALEVRPLGSLRVVALHRSLLLRRACEFFQFVALLFWLHLMLGFFGLLNPLLAGIQAALNASFTIGSLSVSLGGILAFVIAIWASFLVSRFVRFILEEDVYSHLLLERGIPYAISTMLHYAILLLGFFVALGALGIDLTKITILAGAFSVGIGFGLQNIINNFVSGLILLFERPIKIGDIIEVGGNVGEVQRIGIRASIIRTSNGSEVIVPNGSLISSQVTNWTLSDRGRAIEVTVSVASGTNLPKVAELLKSVAMDQPDVAKKPAPQVHLMSMTAGAVAFQVRVWTERSEAWAEIRSDLSLAINERLARENIPLA